MQGSQKQDAVDTILDQWGKKCPELDISGMAIGGRIQRASRMLDSTIAHYLDDCGMAPWEFDVLATLRRTGALATGELARASMVTSGAMTNRVDHLEKKGLVKRCPNPESRRTIMIRLTQLGEQRVDEALQVHVENLNTIFSSLTEQQRVELTDLLRQLLLSMNDH